MSIPRSLLVSLLLGGLVLAVAGCGTGEDRDQASDVVAAFYAAVADDRPADACAQLSTPAASALERQQGEPCPEAVARLDLPASPPPIAGAEVYVVNAKVDLEGGASAFLSRERGGWRISALGCVPVGGKPADRPFECEVEA